MMMLDALRVWIYKETGQDLAEYGLILALIAVVAIAALTGLGRSIVNTLNRLAHTI